MKINRIIIIGTVLLVLGSIVALILPVVWQTKNDVIVNMEQIVINETKKNAADVTGILTAKFDAVRALVHFIEQENIRRGNNLSLDNILDILNDYAQGDTHNPADAFFCYS